MTHRVELRPCDYPYNTLWLIERGQQENHTPTVWYVGHSEHPEDAMYGGRWTENANRAVNFLTRQECETAIFNEFARYKNDPRVNCHASEHVFLSRSETPAAPVDDLVERLRKRTKKCVDEQAGAVWNMPDPDCPMCDNGKLRDPTKEHWDNCAFAAYDAARAGGGK